MKTKEEIKSLVAGAGTTLTKVAEEISKRSKKPLSKEVFFRKLARDTLRYNEYKLIAEILGYEIKLVKKK